MVLPALLVVAALAAEAGAAAPVVMQSPADLDWVDSPVLPGARQAVLWGNPAQSAYGLLRRLPAGAALPWHTHTQDSRAVIVSGTLKAEAEDAPPREMGAGAHIFIPGGRRHRVTCSPAADCLYLEQQPGAADFHPVDAPAPRK
jgi:quercetin dioxygenase-like cupin family protein